VSSGDHTFGSDRIGTLDAGIPHRSQLQSGQPHNVCCGRAGQVWVSDISPIGDCVSERLTLSGAYSAFAPAYGHAKSRPVFTPDRPRLANLKMG
jgi:hypothetical protein